MITPGPTGSFSRDAAYARRRWGDALRTLYQPQKNIEAYLALTRQTRLTAAPARDRAERHRSCSGEGALDLS